LPLLQGQFLQLYYPFFTSPPQHIVQKNEIFIPKSLFGS